MRHRQGWKIKKCFSKTYYSKFQNTGLLPSIPAGTLYSKEINSRTPGPKPAMPDYKEGRDGDEHDGIPTDQVRGTRRNPDHHP